MRIAIFLSLGPLICPLALTAIAIWWARPQGTACDIGTFEA